VDNSGWPDESVKMTKMWSNPFLSKILHKRE
jgi:hypothetical protein